MLDIGCGDGSDCEYYQSLGVEIHGLDASEEFVRKASRLTGFDIRVGNFENIPFADEAFDYIVSKYAIQTSVNMQTCFSEVHRCLKSGGIFQFLVTHPFRQYLEKRDISASYFEQRVVESNFFGDACTVLEPSHTMNEYLNEWMLSRFTLLKFSEHQDAGAEQLDGRVYPGYLIMKFSKHA
jgi:ubiquinone/menaquinone biosynthesis C-methylase UbiE